ncbi:diaminobutyrate acetyltransferase [Candidatus Bathyarchaeota archaeon]|nr:diaminobutyrate acetyltransferase [Candidatus Bathyarchaeota archaeon]
MLQNPKKCDCSNFRIRKVKVEDIKQVYNLLVANRPYVGLNSRYTYFLLAKDFSDSCVVVEHDREIIAFSSGYIPPSRTSTFFSWESVVHKEFRGYNLQKIMFLYQIKITKTMFFEGTVNPSNKFSEHTFCNLAELLNTKCVKKALFSEADFENDGHEAEILFRIGPIFQENFPLVLL